MSKKDLKEMIEKFKFLEKDYSFVRMKPVVPGFLDIIIIDYYKNGSEFIRIEKERGYYDFKIINNGAYINYATLIDKLHLFEYVNKSYYGRDGLIKLSNEISKYLPLFLNTVVNSSWDRQPEV